MNESQASSQDKNSHKPSEDKDYISFFLTTFTTIFLAEIGDKTQIAIILLTAESGHPLIVFLAAASALISSSLVGVLLGRWISTFMPIERFNYIAGALMLAIGLLIGIEATQSLLLTAGLN